MKFGNLSDDDISLIKALYGSSLERSKVEIEIASKFGVSTRTARRWASRLGVNSDIHRTERKILIYDIETPRLKAYVWWSGKQYVHDIIDEPKIISIAWKWLGEDKVYDLHWDLKTKDDEVMVKQFVDVYNEADLVVGINNKNFDDRWVRARAIKHDVSMNAYARTLDVQKEAKRLIRVPSYSMKNLAKYFKLGEQKGEHEGIKMWNMIQEGTMKERKEYMKKMVEYNRQDILTTEALYYKLLPMMRHQTHMGVLNGNSKASCPACGNTERVEKFKTLVTNMGTVQHLMICKDDGHQFKVSHTEYLNFLKDG